MLVIISVVKENARPQGQLMSNIEKQRILDLRKTGLTKSEIKSQINLSQGVLKHFLKLGIDNYGSIKRPGRPQILQNGEFYGKFRKPDASLRKSFMDSIWDVIPTLF